jgi:hypothetical protein
MWRAELVQGDGIQVSSITVIAKSELLSDLFARVMQCRIEAYISLTPNSHIQVIREKDKSPSSGN